MLISGVYFEFCFHQKKQNYKLGDYKKNIAKVSCVPEKSQKKTKQKKTKNINVGYPPTVPIEY